MSKISIAYTWIAFVVIYIGSAFYSSILWAQNPTNIPRDNQPVQFFESWENVVFYLVLPVVIVVLYLIWRRKQNNE